jgi:protein TonB
MKDFRKSCNIADQSTINVKKSQKHDANLRKNSSLYFQIGLILCLLGTYAVFEMRFETKNTVVASVMYEPDETFAFNSTTVIVPDVPKVVLHKKLKKKRIINNPVIIDDISVISDTPILTEGLPVVDHPISPNAVENLEEPIDIPKVFNMEGVEVVPVYPGCEKMTTNVERIQCMNTNIAKLVQRKFDTDLAGQLGLTGTQRISVQFKIDQNGNVTEVLSRAPHPSLEKEARRIAHKIPQMKPGLQREQPVSVLYNLPIVFKVN